jgi:hypothetical protein
MESNKIRLFDVFISGPLQIIVSSYITRSPLLRYFMLLTGIISIIYNGHNFLFFESILKEPLPILNNFVHLNHGKYQLQRLYNLIIMYPVFIYVLLNIGMPYEVRILLLIDIVIGFLYNLFYYNRYKNSLDLEPRNESEVKYEKLLK